MRTDRRREALALLGIVEDLLSGIDFDSVIAGLEDDRVQWVKEDPQTAMLARTTISRLFAARLFNKHFQKIKQIEQQFLGRR